MVNNSFYVELHFPSDFSPIYDDQNKIHLLTTEDVMLQPGEKIRIPVTPVTVHIPRGHFVIVGKSDLLPLKAAFLGNIFDLERSQEVITFYSIKIWDSYPNGLFIPAGTPVCQLSLHDWIFTDPQPE
ncbi:dUTPase2 [bottlenose dolphin adenovirus 2]|uniref:dUTPase2 n=1 Tax=bottlenose dolphin adenovirus 2 TaxID=2849592 RepID=A0A0M3T9N1_9ADEN|nr:dUTPase2 [Bottlenose dolphin adenovirus 1]ALE15316.1 dUTPase2 [Bottlenose dolphin adenovirus 1]